jgi:hypothetical protein
MTTNAESALLAIEKSLPNADRRLSALEEQLAVCRRWMTVHAVLAFREPDARSRRGGT